MTSGSSETAGATASATPAAVALDEENNAFKNAAAASTDDQDSGLVWRKP